MIISHFYNSILDSSIVLYHWFPHPASHRIPQQIQDQCVFICWNLFNISWYSLWLFEVFFFPFFFYFLAMISPIHINPLGIRILELWLQKWNLYPVLIILLILFSLAINEDNTLNFVTLREYMINKSIHHLIVSMLCRLPIHWIQLWITWLQSSCYWLATSMASHLIKCTKLCDSG